MFICRTQYFLNQTVVFEITHTTICFYIKLIILRQSYNIFLNSPRIFTNSSFLDELIPVRKWMQNVILIHLQKSEKDRHPPSAGDYEYTSIPVEYNEENGLGF